MTPMAEEEEDNYDIDDLGRSNNERRDGDPDDANADNAEAVDMKDGDSDDADMDGPNYDNAKFLMMILTSAMIPSQIMLKMLTLIYMMLIIMPLMMLTLIMLMLVLMPNMVLAMIYMTTTTEKIQTTLKLMTLMIQKLIMSRFAIWCGPSLPCST